MIGVLKPAAIRAELRKALQMSDAELIGWFNEQPGATTREQQERETEIRSLYLFRDALVRETKCSHK